MNILTRFYRELRRRQVFGVVALYTVAAWAVIEVGDMAISSGLVSGMTTRNLFTLALIGFPLALIAGWFYNVTRQGIFRTASAGADESSDRKLQVKDYLLLAILLAIWSGTYVYLHTPPAVDKSIAVMPFENRGNDPENAHFAFGIHDDLMTQLQRIGDLKLIAAPSVRAIDPDTPVEQAALKLGVVYIMKGSVERILDRIRVNVILLDAAHDEQTWAGSFDRELSAVNLFDIRDEITQAITGELQAILSPAEQTWVFDQPTTSLAASSHYARGRQLMVNRQVDELSQAIKEFEAAVEIDPDFALAWAGMADAAMLAADVGAIGYEEGYEIRKLAVNRAMALNDQLAEVWVAYGDLVAIEKRWGLTEDDAFLAFKKAINFSPNYALAYHRYAFNLRGVGQADRRTALWQKAMQLNPLAPTYQDNLANQLMNQGRDEEALQHLVSLLESNPDYYGTYLGIASLHEDEGHINEAIQWIKKGLQVAPANAHFQYRLARYYSELDLMDRVNQIRQQMAERFDFGDPWMLEVDLWILASQLDWEGQIALLDRVPAFWIDHPDTQYLKGSVHFDLGNMQRARDYWERLKLANWPRWPTVAGGNCHYVQVIMKTGDQTHGRRLLKEALEYFEATLTSETGHADLDGRRGVCYLLDDRPDEALDFFSQRVGHGHFTDWQTISRNPLLGPFRDDPRMITLDQKVETLIAEQREMVLEMERTE